MELSKNFHTPPKQPENFSKNPAFLYHLILANTAFRNHIRKRASWREREREREREAVMREHTILLDLNGGTRSLMKHRIYSLSLPYHHYSLFSKKISNAYSLQHLSHDWWSLVAIPSLWIYSFLNWKVEVNDTMSLFLRIINVSLKNVDSLD